jgi:hypothetical protein
VFKNRPASADAARMASPARRLITLRYAASCVQCGQALEAGSEAWWDRDRRTVTCLSCKLEAPSDPFTDIDDELRGTAGGSAQEEADRRNHAGHSDRSTEPWEKGSHGERLLSKYLHEEAGRGQLLILDDRQIPGAKANIDLIAIAPTGVYVIDAKKYDGKVELRTSGFGRWRQEQLIVKGRDRTHLVDGMERQVRAVREALDSGEGNGDVPVRSVVCFVGAEWDLLSTAFTVNGVDVMAPRALRRRLRKEGPLGVERRTQMARLFSLRLLPAFALSNGRGMSGAGK